MKGAFCCAGLDTRPECGFAAGFALKTISRAVELGLETDILSRLPVVGRNVLMQN
jgi:hypothetical protein